MVQGSKVEEDIIGLGCRCAGSYNAAFRKLGSLVSGHRRS